MGAWDHPLVGFHLLVKHHLPGIGALDPEVLGRFPFEEGFDLGRDDIGYPAHRDRAFA